MRDVNSAILQAYYEIISALDIPVYEGEEPDDVKHKIYCVINDATSNETSTANSSDVNLTIQISVHSWEYKYNNSKNLNAICGQIIEALRPEGASNIDLSAYGLQMCNMALQTDRTERIGNLGGKAFISRILIFKQDIFVIS